MSNKKSYAVKVAGIMAETDLSLRAAILYAIQFEGNQANFSRDQDGNMALRTDHPDSTYLSQFSSNLPNDEEAVAAIGGPLLVEIKTRMNHIEIMTHQQEAARLLHKAIKSYEHEMGPGKWIVKGIDISEATSGQPIEQCIGLAYEWPKSIQERGEVTGDEPWTEWGGNDIIQRANCYPTAGFSLAEVDTCALLWWASPLTHLPGSRRPAESFFWHLRDNTILEKTGIVKILGESDDDPILIQLPRQLMRDHSLAAQKVEEAIVEANRVSQQGRDGAYFETLQAELAKASIRTLHEPNVLHLKYRWDSDCSDVLGDMSEDAQTDVVITNAAAVFEHWTDPMLELESASDDEQPSLIDPDNCALINIERVKITYPRSDRYGVPECTTDSGARKYLKSLGFRVPAKFEVETEDSGDDTSMQITIWGKAPQSIIVTPEPPTDRQAER